MTDPVKVSYDKGIYTYDLDGVKIQTKKEIDVKNSVIWDHTADGNFVKLSNLSDFTVIGTGKKDNVTLNNCQNGTIFGGDGKDTLKLLNSQNITFFGDKSGPDDLSFKTDKILGTSGPNKDTLITDGKSTYKFPDQIKTNGLFTTADEVKKE